MSEASRVTTASSALPRPRSGSELAALLEAERTGAPFLLLRTGDDEQRIVPLDPGGGTVTLGRNDANDVAVPWDGEVSRVHAELCCTGGEWLVIDDELSRNGSFLNGSRVRGRSVLCDGDVLRVGRTLVQFRWVRDGVPDGTVASSEATGAVELTAAQRRVLVALCRPYKDAGITTPASNQEVADELVVSVEAVKTALRVLFAKFGVADLPQNRKRTRLVELALETGTVSPRDL